MNDLVNAKAVYAIYSAIFAQPFSIQRKSVIFSAVTAGEPWSWLVIGISQAALEALAENGYRYKARTVCRAHLVDRITTAASIFSLSEPLQHERLFELLVANGRTIITTKSENKSAPRLPAYLPIDSSRGLFKNQLISFAYRRTEREALRALHADFKDGKLSLVRPAGATEEEVRSDGKRVFVGTIGKTKYLLDAGNGEIVLELKSGRDVAKHAASANRTVVPRSEASAYAKRSLITRWAEARKAINETAGEGALAGA